MKWMTIRTFLRGGYQKITEPTIITKQGYPYFTVMPAKRGQDGVVPQDPNPERDAR